MNFNEREYILSTSNFSRYKYPKPAIFLDRDGVIIEDKHYISDPYDVKLEKGFKNFLSEVNNFDLPIIVITNQSGISRGILTWDDYDKVTKRMIDLIEGPSPIAAIYANSHLKINSKNWRKPNPYMLYAAAKKLNLDLSRSILIGDRLSDIKAAINARIRIAFHLLTGHGNRERESVLNFKQEQQCSLNHSITEIVLLNTLKDFPFDILN